jgi:hypothetical protein
LNEGAECEHGRPERSAQATDALLQHAVPGVVARVGETHVLAHAPLLEQHSRRVFTAKKGGDGLFECSAEEHGGARVFLLPSIKVAVSVTARAAKVLTDLGVGVGHRDASAVLERESLVAGADDSSSHWLAGAKPSRSMSEMPLITVWLILTTPRPVGQRAEKQVGRKCNPTGQKGA